MFLEKICVPDFRVLKNVEISFEKEFNPSIFPLGSLNGGGKSTLLQLIFVLLHCSINPDRIIFLKNLLSGFNIYKNSDRRILAKIDIWEGNKTVELEFFCSRESFIESLFKGKSIEMEEEEIFVSPYKELQKWEIKILSLEKIIKSMEVIYEDLIDIEENKSSQHNVLMLKNILQKLENLKVENFLRRNQRFRRIISYLSDFKINTPIESRLSNNYLEKILSLTRGILNDLNIEINELKARFKDNQILLIQILKEKNMIYICDNPSNFHDEEREILICSFKNIDIDEATVFLERVSERTFLAAHVSQVFLFLPPDSRKLLFKSQSQKELRQNDYYTQLRKEKPKIPGFFTYDFLAIDILIESFIKARDIDFRQAIETGEYGSNYKQLLEDLNFVLSNKNININNDLSGVTFKVDADDIELYPEDLSHGELKRLCIYMWLKHNKIENSIVLMDEIEIAFHPDWQYQIVRDIEQWSPSNQYILATHSYELCQAVTPAHVKELEPKLTKNAQ
ncbi:ATP-binding protein [Aetokthonos hydrillicola Thurmond2011]|jgi:hypothetical protein|uniref:ATP-binding protein n=1 Tax=Aetokthonos hydrillicola Thurmond2011 TaxID=2712845 RepID=A0AAP5IFL2_9CYAN|nr:AAA family ATPase [Aetokthonos hydrillicola]MBO3462036.1 AAA family ATPase [Aetokthonos hydrillicola CCALA 1050]MBW4589357.1 ATP-binding protein [Aetokthonos hydrillicola CCALA 1050]MDR9898110.1 ATP-binding protein [Aetokthonos hydrillicola Thurmond2011]